jgi:hypothetical protein
MGSKPIIGEEKIRKTLRLYPEDWEGAQEKIWAFWRQKEVHVSTYFSNRLDVERERLGTRSSYSVLVIGLRVTFYR